MKKSSSDWNAGLIHFGIAAVAVPVVLSIMLSLPYWFMLEYDLLPRNLDLFAFPLLSGIPVYVLITNTIILLSGTWYSARYFKRNIIVNHSKQVIIYATVYLALFSALFDYWDYYNLSQEGMVPENYFVLMLVKYLASLAMFYGTSWYFFKKQGVLN